MMSDKAIDCRGRPSETTSFEANEMNDSAKENLPIVNHKEGRRRCFMPVEARKTLIGVAIVIGIALSWVASTQFAQSTYSEGFNAPFFITWFSTDWKVAVFPLYTLPLLIRGNSFRSFLRESETVLGRRGLSLTSIFTHVGPFCLIWMITNYLYIRALGSIPAADVTALFSSCSAFVYLFSWIWLQQRFSIIKLSAVLLSIGGIVLMAYAEGFVGPSALGVVLSVGAAIGAALYKVLFKRLVGDASAGQVSLFLSCLGLLDALLLWPIALILYYTNYEQINWETIPWNFLCGAAALSLAFDFLINFGIAFTYPLFISLGTVLGIPINALADLIFRGKAFGSIKVFAAIAIVGGFLMMLFPEWWDKRLQEKICCRKYSSLDETVESDVNVTE